MPTNQIINDVIPWTQASAAPNQTVFDTNWTAAYAADIVVYQRAMNDEPDELTQMLLESEYLVTFVGTGQIVRVTLLTPATNGDIITIVRNTPVDRLNLYTNTNFVPSMLNQDTALLTLVDQERQMMNLLSIKYHISGVNPNFSATVNPPVVPLGPNQIWAMNPNGDAFIAYNVPEDGSIATALAKYILQQPHIGLPNAQAMSELPTGFVVSNNLSGVQVTRSIEGTIHQIVIGNPTGVDDNPIVGIAENAIIPGTAGMGIPAGTTAQRVTPTPPSIGMRFNTDLGQVEAYIGSQWVAIPSAAAGLFLPLAGGTMTGNINMGGHIIDDLPLPTTDNEAASKIYVDNVVGGAAGGVTGNLQWNNDGAFSGDPNFNTDGAGNVTIVGSLTADNLRLDGNTLSSTDANGDINLTPNGTGQVKVPTPTAVNSAVTKAYADAIQAQLANYLLRSGGTMTGPINMGNSKITSLATPTVGTDAVTKDYVDATAAGKYFVAPVRASATANFSATYNNGVSGVGATLTATANGAAAFDGVTFALNDRVLFPFQSSSLQNGIYIVTNLGGPSAQAVYTRAVDYDQPSEIDPGDSVGVTQGTLYSGAFFMQTATVTTIGTSPINFSLSVNPNVVTLSTTQTITGAKTFTSPLDIQANTITVGSPRTDATLKIWLERIPSYNNADGFFSYLFPVSDSGLNRLNIGGGSSTANAATETRVFAAANNTTPTGSVVADFNISGMRLGNNNSRVIAIFNDATMAANSATALATQQSIKGYVDSQNSSGTFTPTISFAVPGDLSVSYTSQAGTWVRFGNILTATFTASFTPTFTTASGNLLLLGFPVAASGLHYGANTIGGTGLTFPGSRTSVCAAIYSGTATGNIVFSGPSIGPSILVASSIASGVSMAVNATITYRV